MHEGVAHGPNQMIRSLIFLLFSGFSVQLFDSGLFFQFSFPNPISLDFFFEKTNKGGLVHLRNITSASGEARLLKRQGNNLTDALALLKRQINYYLLNLLN